MQGFEFPFSITPQETLYDLCICFHTCLRKKSGRELSRVAAEMFRAWYYAPGMIGDNMVVQKVYPSVQAQLRALEQQIRESLVVDLDMDCSEFEKLIDVYNAFRKQFKLELGEFESFVGYETLIDVWFKLYETGAAPWHLIPEREVGIDAWLREHNQENHRREPPSVTGVNSLTESSVKAMLNKARTYSAIPEKPPEKIEELRTVYDYHRLQPKQMTRIVVEEKVKPETEQVWVGSAGAGFGGMGSTSGLSRTGVGLRVRDKGVADLLSDIDKSLASSPVGTLGDSSEFKSGSKGISPVSESGFKSKINGFNWTQPELESICIYIQRVYPEATAATVDELFRRDPRKCRVCQMCDDHNDLACFVEIYTRQQVSLARGDAFFSEMFDRYGSRTLAELRAHLATLVSRSV